MIYSRCISRHTKLPLPHFTATNVVGTILVDFEYTGDTTGVKDYIWSFGDNTYAYAQNPSHTYTTGGIYTISLIIGNGVITKSISLTISVSSVDDDFTGTDGDAPNSVLWEHGPLYPNLGENLGEIYNNSLLLEYNGSNFTQVGSIFRLIGDFDLQINFSEYYTLAADKSGGEPWRAQSNRWGENRTLCKAVVDTKTVPVNVECY